MRVTFLGTGTSHGIPVIGCECAVCRSDDPRNKRLRPSVFVEAGHTSLLIDATPDLRTQALRAGIRDIDAVLVTHTHADHFLGLDDLRVFTQRAGRPMPIHGLATCVQDIQRVFPYACTEKPAWPGMPSFALQVIEPDVEFAIGDLRVRAVELLHGKLPVLGFVFGRQFAYLTDCNVVAPGVVESLRGVTLLALDALRYRPHPTHLTVEAAVEIAGRVDAKLTLLTHMNHEVDHERAERELPERVRLAFDGLRLAVNEGEVRVLD